ncbi:MAG: TIGR04282 family arsenosugar biosynthesis glycosyltransferase [Saprospiraceae bacterium]
MEETLLIFIKNPVLGRVKTRLAATLGAEAALAAYQELLAYTRAVATRTACCRWLYYSDYLPEADEWPAQLFEKHLQAGADLGQRMTNAFESAFEAGADRVLIIGSDCPGITPAILAEGFEALRACDFVLGPSTDGGYYLLGMRRFQASLFEGIAWSSPTVCAETLLRMEALGGNCRMLPALMDIDTEADWNAIGGRVGLFPE